MLKPRRLAACFDTGPVDYDALDPTGHQKPMILVLKNRPSTMVKATAPMLVNCNVNGTL